MKSRLFYALVFALGFPFAVSAQTNIGGGVTSSTPQVYNNMVINSGVNTYNSYIQAINSDNSGGLFTINNGTNTFNSTVSANGAGLITGTNTGGQLVIANGTNKFNDTVTINSGLGSSANASLNITGGTLNQFSSAVNVNGGSVNSCNGLISISGSTTVFYSTVTAGSSTDSTSGIGGTINLSGGTVSFYDKVTAQSGTSAGTITISSSAANPVTLFGFDYSNFQTPVSITGSVIMDNMTLSSQSITAVGNVSLESTSSTGTMTLSGGSITSNTGIIALNNGTLSGNVTLNAPIGSVSFGGIAVDNTAQVTVNAPKVYFSSSVAGTVNTNATTAYFISSSTTANQFYDITGSATTSLISSGTNNFNGLLSGMKNINITGGKNTFSNSISVTDYFDISAGTNNFNQSITSGNTMQLTGGTNTFNNTVSTTSGNILVSGGTNTFSNSLTAANGLIEISGGTNSFDDLNSTVSSSSASGYPGQVQISGGINTFNNSQINSGLSLTGSSTFLGNAVLGTDSSLSADSSLTINGTVTFIPTSYSGSPIIDASGVGNVDVVSGSQVNMDISQLPTGTSGNIVLIKGPSTRVGNPDSIDGSYSSLLYSYSYQWDSNNFDLTVNYIKTAQSVANQLGGNAPAAYTLRPTQTQDIFNTSTQDQAYSNVEAATGSLYATAAAANDLRLNYINQMMLMNLETCCQEQLEYRPNQYGGYDAYAPLGYIRPTLPAQPHLWISGLGLGGCLRDNNGVSGGNLSSAGFLLGWETPADSVRLGVYYGITRTTITSSSTSLESTDQNFGFYGKWDSWLMGGYSTFFFNFSFSPYDGVRQYNQSAWDSSFNSWQTTWLYEKGWNFRISRGNFISPFAACQYMHYHSDGFSDGDLTVSEMDLDTTRIIIGARLKQILGTVCLHEEIAYHQNFNGNQASFIAQSSSASALVLGDDIGNAWAQFNVKIAWNVDDDFTVSGNYYLMVNGHSTVNAGMGTVTLKF